MKYIFLHIPKNGGTTLQHIIDHQYKKYQIYNIPDSIREESLLKLKNKNFLQKKRIKIVKGGHFNYGCHLYFSRPENVKYFAFLRHPLSRAISYYSYVKRTPQHYLHSTIISESISLEDFLDRSDLNFEICNGQTKLIAGIDQDKQCNEEDFKMALTHLSNSFFFVGIMERYQESLFILKKKLSWHKPIRYQILNVNNNDEYKISSEISKKLLSMNNYDLKIYNTYLEVFHEITRSFDLEEFNEFKKSLRTKT